MADVAQPNPSNPSALVPVFPDSALALTKSDTSTYPLGVFVYAGGAGTVTIVPFGLRTALTTVAFEVPAGGMVPCRAYMVMSAGTDATDLVGIY
jgi:hypothetical protein